eukprot:gene313-6727_t
MNSSTYHVQNVLNLYKLLLRSTYDKVKIPSVTSRVYIRNTIKSTFKQYKDEPNEKIIKIQLQRGLNYLSAIYEE